MAVLNRRLSLGILGLAFILGSFNTVQLLPTMDEMEYSQAGYFTITNQDRSRQIWHEEPMIFYQGRPELIERGPPYNVTSRELMAWSDIIFDYNEHLSERGVQLSLILEGRNGVIKVGICDLTEEKAQLFVDIMKHYVPMGVIILQNATIITITGRSEELEYTEPNTQLRLEVITDKTEYMCGEEITVECVVINDSPRAVNTTMPSTVGATTYSKADPDSMIRTACDISWVKREIEVPANSRKTITTFRFRCDVEGEFVIDVHGYPLIEVMVGVPHAWIMANRVGEGGTGTYRDVNQTDVNDFTHLVKAMTEDVEATRRGLAHADHMTRCPAKEAIEIVEFFGEEYQPDLGYYDYKVVLDDGRKYLFSIRFSWETPIVD